ncbi:CLUMA_CG005794, isoform A [Clunio marinus]|uniref:CLUMA_CG005794, isoform A n=1 Tax=Clunio marinus TaxID=568069 RepID=A0A1J1I0A8_9DIPT|nr:CLUMA_CG005794, isoform A [Clunio marinus]
MESGVTFHDNPFIAEISIQILWLSTSFLKECSVIKTILRDSLNLKPSTYEMIDMFHSEFKYSYEILKKTKT